MESQGWLFLYCCLYVSSAFASWPYPGKVDPRRYAGNDYHVVSESPNHNIYSISDFKVEHDEDLGAGIGPAYDIEWPTIKRRNKESNSVEAYYRETHTTSVSSTRSKNLSWQTLNAKIKTATANLHTRRVGFEGEKDVPRVKSEYLPGQPAGPFTLDTLNGTLSYPSEELSNKSLIFHTFDNRSAFLECLWTSESSLQSLAASPDSVHYVFMSPSNQAKQDAAWMHHQLYGVLGVMRRNKKLSAFAVRSLKARLHFVTTPTFQLGNWIPGVLMEWACQDHGCGLSQAVFKSIDGGKSLNILKRLDARYDWLPSPASFSSPKTVTLAADGCAVRNDVSDKVAVIENGNCSFSTKVSNMESSGAVGVIVYSRPGEPVQDMNCEGAECDSPPSIPATMIPHNDELLDSLENGQWNVSFQTTPSENFYFAIDAQGLLAEMGWLLFPSFQFFVWQAQWFDYRTELLRNLSQEVLLVPIVNDTIMQGHQGVVKTIKMPSLEKVTGIELDAALSCPGTRDESCPPWDHTVQLYLCCDENSPLCGMELGRWITPFRRRIGRWLTDVSPLAPLFTSDTCTFTMQTAWWAQAWTASLNLRIHRAESADSGPKQIIPLFRGGTFNQTYNSHRKPINFTVAEEVRKVVLYAVITGHGSDNNGCGEFCVTSHHFVVNDHPNVNKFTNAGTPEGCADRTPTGVEPNEHGTWLYGRDGWCDGREVDPWVVDITAQVKLGTANTITYFGWFNGTDPNPTTNPGEIIMYSYLVYYM
ncbi:uncharacterized protein [Diadema antillarum]|uniref:uncharacterized protein n=1 Tax=Diadema antillarum TaxID=105358 RepID=UPI003A875828